uniref:YtxH domain-containing protein n=1 Tax=Panagrellus redivivus TaxID=6233 RepID=A0A7E4W1E5_PANRE
MQYNKFAKFVLHVLMGLIISIVFRFLYKNQKSFVETLNQKLDPACKRNGEYTEDFTKPNEGYNVIEH